MSTITVVFPMGGEGQRFGNKFKPFLKIFDKTFIELAINPFLKHKELIKEFVFIVREDHYNQFNIENKFKEFNLPIPYSIKTITKTNSPIETINEWLKTNIQNVIFCDCDHSVDVTPIFSNLEHKHDCIIMGYNILIDEVASWSIAASYNGKVNAIAEKQVPTTSDQDKINGVIGCYYFKEYSVQTTNNKYISDVISNLINQNKDVRIVECKKADFFGDPKRLNNLYKEKNANTIFCDIDGTIIKHENIPNYKSGFQLLDGAKEKIKEWRKDNNCFIVLTTSRDEQFRPELELLLKNNDIIYENLVMGLPPGPRHLINDKKPYSNKTMALAHEVERDVGIKNLNLGHSMAILHEQNNFIVKTLPDNFSEYQKNKFKSQYESMKNISESNYSYCVPKIGEFNNNQYSMENLIGYCGLHLVTNDERYTILQKVFNTIKDLYDFTTPTSGWLAQYLEEKIYSKQKTINDLGLEYECKEIFDLINKLDKNKLQLLEPKMLTNFYFGDLTYENILTNGKDFKFIDFDNDNRPGVAEQDLGKLLQSYLTKYEWWDEEESPEYASKEYDLIIRFYADLLNEPYIRVVNKGNFYCAMHLFRMIPYQANKNIKRAKRAINMCRVFLESVKTI